MTQVNMETSDYELLTAWASGDKRAGDTLFGRYFDNVYRFFRNKVGDDAEDLIQKTFLGCVEASSRFRRDSSFRTFLFSIARNQLLRHFSAKTRDARLDFGVSSIHDMAPSPRAQIADKREQRLLLAALRRIPVDLQIVLELHYWEGLTGPALAEVLEIPEGTVRSRLRRAREILVKRMSELSDSEEVLRSTIDNLEQWAASLGQLVLRDNAT